LLLTGVRPRDEPVKRHRQADLHDAHLGLL
jgi:hypothetical protein